MGQNKRLNIILLSLLVILFIIGCFLFIKKNKTPALISAATDLSILSTGGTPVGNGNHQLIYYLTDGKENAIYSYDGKKTRKLFTDIDEKRKIVGVSNLDETDKSVLLLLSGDTASANANLALVSLDGKGKVVDISKLSYSVQPPLPVITSLGDKIAFVTYRFDGGLLKYIIYIVNRDGKNLREIVSETDPITDLRWSPDGRIIVYTTCQAAQKCKLMASGLFPENIKKQIIPEITGYQGISWVKNNLINYVKTSVNSNNLIALDLSDFKQTVINPNTAETNRATLSPDYHYLAYIASPAKEVVLKANQPGDITIKDLEKNEVKIIGRGISIIGWLP